MAMVIGVGLDLSSVSYWADLAADRKTAALAGTFTPGELARCFGHPEGPGPRLAARFAAKEAFVKALGATRFGQEPAVSRLDPREVEVQNDSCGRPCLVLHGEAGAVARRLGVRHIWLSLTHEDRMAAAVVVLEG